MKFKSRLVLLLTMLMMLQSALFGGAAFAAGTNLPNITEYGLYSYVNSNDTPPTAIQVKNTGNGGSTYTSWPWDALTQIPYVFESNTGIGIKFATNVATPTYWDQNATKLKMYNSAGGQVAASVIRLGDGANTDNNRNYIFVIPQGALQPSSTYKIVVDADLTSNNGNQAGKIQQVDFTTAADSTRPSWSSGSLMASGIGDTSLTLTWNSGAQDDVAVTGYKILKNGSKIGTVSGGSTLSYSVTGLTPGTSYSFQVLAYDAAGNSSTNGPSTSATTGTANDSTSVSLSLNKTSAPPGGSITVSGAAGPSRWVSIQAMDSSNNIVFFDAVKSSASGSYSDTFKVPAVSAGSYTVLAGYGSNVASAGLNVIPEITSDVSISGDGSNKNLALTANTPASVSVTVPQGVSDASLNVAELLSSNVGGVSTSPLPSLNIRSNVTLNSSPVQVTVAIPAGTVVSAASDWDGTINMPTVQAASSVSVTPDAGKSATVSAVIEIGFGDVPLTFSKAVRILIPAQAGKDVGYYRSGAFTQITTNLVADTQAAGDALAAGGDGKINVGSDLVVWTKHFTQFVTYTQITGGSGDNSGGGSNTNAPTWPSGSKLTGTKSEQVVTLTWTAATDSVGVTGYKIYMDDGTKIASVDGSTLTCQISNVNGQRSFKVEAGNAAGYWTTDGPSSTKIGGGGNNPLNYISSNLTSISGNVSSSGESVDGSSSVPVNPVIRIVFDRNVTGDAIWPGNQQCFTMQGSNGANVPITVSRILNTDNFDERQHIFVTPQSSLTAGKGYEIIISGSLKANNGRTMDNTATISFTVAGGAPITSNGPTITTGDGSVDPAVGATVGQGGFAKVVIPANALKGSSTVTVKVAKVDSPPAAPADAKAISDVYEFKVGDSASYSFASNVAITMSFDPAKVTAEQEVALFYYDESQSKWVKMDGSTIEGNTITVQIDHFTKFGVFAIKKTAVVPTVPTITKPQVNLKDIQNHWAKAAIEKLLLLGAVSGYPDGTFKPDANISRAEFVTILVKAFNMKGSSNKVFKDTQEHWAKDYIATASALGIASGYSDQLFGANDLITREQMAVMVVKAAKLAAATGDNNFADKAQISPWAKDAMAIAIKNGIMKGYPDNTIRPKDKATRGEAASLIGNALK